ncbi:MAG: acyl-CoA/acyl-ACP dehydrogenase [Candidatus Heimdallarchaeota archaeon]|nr:MAG: acyl-CoA/acyl-ACP dehydrogenase [Candidatus Heimdallarchaeota archaeon]
MFDVLLNEKETELKYQTREFVKSIPSSWLRKMDREEIQYPTDYVKKLGKEELLGVRFPSKYGGKNLGWVAETAAIEEIGVLGPSLGCLYSLVSIVGEAIHHYGNEDQKKKYLEPIIKGKLFCAEALTEPRGGSDFFGATCIAEKQGDDFILNGQKRFVVGSEGADFFLVYAKTDLKAIDPKKSISTFIVQRDKGVEVKHVYGLMGSRGGGTGRINFNNVEVPGENLVGEINQGGEIFNQMMIPERMTSASGAIGSARAGLEVAAKYSNRRKAFGQVIRKFQAVSFKLADSVTLLDAARSLIYSTASTIDANQGITSGNIRRMVSESKKFATDAAWEVINHAMQIMGGIGYTNVYPVERLLRDIRLMSIWTGTNEIMNLLIQHEYYRELLGQPENLIPRNVEEDAVGAEYAEEKVFE